MIDDVDVAGVFFVEDDDGRDVNEPVVVFLIDAARAVLDAIAAEEMEDDAEGRDAFAALPRADNALDEEADDPSTLFFFLLLELLLGAKAMIKLDCQFKVWQTRGETENEY